MKKVSKDESDANEGKKFDEEVILLWGIEEVIILSFINFKITVKFRKILIY